MSYLLNPHRFAAPAAAPALVSRTAYVPGSATHWWKPFTALDLSDCDLAIFCCLLISTGRYPDIDNSVSTGWTYAGRSLSAPLPSGINSVGRLGLYWKAAPTTEETLAIWNAPNQGANDTVTANFAGILYRVSNADTVACAMANSGSTNSTAANPPNLSLGATRDALLIAAMGINSNNAAGLVYPTGYGDGATQAVSSGVGGRISAASRAARVSAEDPDPFTNISARWGAYTIACYQA